MSRGFFLIITAILFSFGASAGPNAVYTPITPESGWQFGMEIEVIGHQGLRNLMGFFDIVPTISSNESENRVTSERIRKAIDLLQPLEVDNYLTPDTINSLPSAIREKLLDGKDLKVNLEVPEKSLEKVPEPKLPASGTIESLNAARQMRSQGGLILPDGYNIDEGRREIYVKPGTNTSGEIVVRKEALVGQDWSHVAARWRAMDLETKKAVMDINSISPLVKAILVKDGVIPPEWLKPKSTIGGATKDLLSRLRWYRESGITEFNHRVPVTSKESYLKDVALFSDLLGIRKYMEDPTLPQLAESEFAYHMHVSRHGEDLTEVAERFNRLRLLQLANTGRGPAGLQRQYGYRRIKDKGLVRLVDRNHIESRTRAVSPSAEVEHMVDAMSKPTGESISKLDAEIKAESEKLMRTTAETARRAVTISDEVVRAAMKEKVTSGFEILGLAAGTEWPQKFIDEIVSVGTQSEQKRVIAQLVRLNDSVFGSRLLAAVATRGDLDAHFDRIATSYLEAGAGGPLVKDFIKRGYSEEELLGKLQKPFRNFLESEIVDRAGRASLFIETLPPSMHQKFWEAQAEKARSIIDIYMLARAWVPPENPALLAEAAKRAGSLLGKKIFELPGRLGDHLKVAFDLRGWMTSPGIIREFARELLNHARTQSSFSLADDNATWLTEYVEKSDIGLLKKSFTADAPVHHRILKKLLDFGEPIDVNVLDRFLRKAVVTNVREVLPSLGRIVSEGSKDERRKIVRLAREGAFYQLPFSGIASTKHERSFFLNVAQDIITESAPSERDRDFIRSGLKRSVIQDSFGAMPDKLIHDTILRSLRSPIHPEWRAMILDSWKDERFISTVVGPPRVAWSREWFEFLNIEMKSGGDNGAKAAQVFDRILVGEKNLSLFQSAGDSLARELLAARKSYPPLKYSGFELGRIAHAGRAAADFVIEQIGEDASRVSEIAKDKLGSKAVRERLLERQLVQDRNGKRSALYQVLNGAPESSKARVSLAKMFQADVANLAPVNRLPACAERFERLGH